MFASVRRSLAASTSSAAASSSRLIPLALNRSLSSSPTPALHESLPLDPISSVSSSSSLSSSSAAGAPPSRSRSMPPGPASASGPTPWPTAESLLHAPSTAASSSSSTPSGRAVALLNSQPQKYIQMSLYKRRYLLHAKDVLTVPHLKPLVRPGTKLALTRVFEVGTHDFALKAAKGSRLTGVKVEATVLENTTSPMTFKHLKKRRKGYKKEIRSKMRYTRLRIGEIIVEGTGQATDLEPTERTLDRPVSKPYDQYAPTDNSIRGRLARQFGVVDYEHHRHE